MRDAREHITAGGGPVLVEMMCYRFLSHTTDDDDRTYRTRDEVAEYRPSDPVPKFEQYLLEHAIAGADDVAALKREITSWSTAPPTKSKPNRTPPRKPSTATPTPAPTTPGWASRGYPHASAARSC